ncbi:MAG TPA: hypothetical protein VF033_00020 [Steroidobacteraceae bacterium]|jgi:hypothetical protein
MKNLRIGMLALWASLAACTPFRPPAETTADGLERVPSRPEGGVYRKIDVDFNRYKRLMIEPLTVEYREGWRKQHPDVSDVELRRIEIETVKNFRDVFTEVLVDEGPFELAEVREADVLVVVPRMRDLKIPAPETSSDTGYQSFSLRAISMEMTGELRDGISGDVLLRVNMIEPEGRENLHKGDGPNRISNAREIRLSMEKWSRLVREAFDVAKASKPR